MESCVDQREEANNKMDQNKKEYKFSSKGIVVE